MGQFEKVTLFPTVLTKALMKFCAKISLSLLFKKTSCFDKVILAYYKM